MHGDNIGNDGYLSLTKSLLKHDANFYIPPFDPHHLIEEYMLFKTRLDLLNHGKIPYIAPLQRSADNFKDIQRRSSWSRDLEVQYVYLTQSAYLIYDGITNCWRTFK